MTCMSHRNRVEPLLMKIVVGSPVIIVPTYQLRSCSSILKFIFLSIYFILSDILVLLLLFFSMSYSFRYPRIVKNRASLPPPHFIHILFPYISDMFSYSDYAIKTHLNQKPTLLLESYLTGT